MIYAPPLDNTDVPGAECRCTCEASEKERVNAQSVASWTRGMSKRKAIKRPVSKEPGILGWGVGINQQWRWERRERRSYRNS
jgi:hypothetical protein